MTLLNSFLSHFDHINPEALLTLILTFYWASYRPMPLSKESNKDNYLSTLIMLSSGLLNMLNVLKWFPYYFGDYYQQNYYYYFKLSMCLLIILCARLLGIANSCDQRRLWPTNIPAMANHLKITRACNFL